MEISVTGRHMTISESLKSYAEEKIGGAMKVMDIDPLVAEVILHVEKNRANPRPCVCEVTMTTRGHIIRVEEAEEDMFAAIDVAAAKVVRQMRKYKTRVVDRKIRAEAPDYRSERSDPDYDALMEELSADEVVRVKEIDFEPLTEEEALVKIDLLGHDFFAYTDRDTNAVCVLYRRTNGGYGLLKQVL
ncbi:MAG: ribosome-associated translation inhibitor RaiA [Eggerthellaceae bacterium]|nr:ribosome-associated translation inhibitor RaiA [Eggerthellaceae bacterium]